MSDERLAQLRAEAEELWGEMKLLMDSMEGDLAKSLNGVGTATTRVRKGLALVTKNGKALRGTLLELRKVKAELKKS